MHRLAEVLYTLAVALWVGGMLAIGYIAAPTLFAQLSDRSLAGTLAGRMFAVIAWVGIGCAVYLVVFLLARRGWAAFRLAVFWIVILMFALTLAGHFGITPILAQLRAQAFPREVMETIARDRFATWHGISSGLYLLQSVLGIALVALHGRAIR